MSTTRTIARYMDDSNSANRRAPRRDVVPYTRYIRGANPTRPRYHRQCSSTYSQSCISHNLVCYLNTTHWSRIIDALILSIWDRCWSRSASLPTSTMPLRWSMIECSACALRKNSGRVRVRRASIEWAVDGEVESVARIWKDCLLHHFVIVWLPWDSRYARLLSRAVYRSCLSLVRREGICLCRRLVRDIWKGFGKGKWNEAANRMFSCAIIDTNSSQVSCATDLAFDSVE